MAVSVLTNAPRSGTDVAAAYGEKLQLIFGQASHLTALRLFVKWNAFEEIPPQPGASVSYAALAAKIGADVPLISELPCVIETGESAAGRLRAIDSSPGPGPRRTRDPRPSRKRHGRPHRLLAGAPGPPRQGRHRDRIGTP